MTRQISLTPAQEAAVSDPRPRLLLRAPAGSGKTEVLARRVERILHDSAGAAFRILAVTYTVKAAEELRSRIKSTVATEAWRVDCETLHSFAHEWLIRYGTSVGVGPAVVVFAEDVDRLALIADYLRTLGLPPHVTTVPLLQTILREIDTWRTSSAPGTEMPDTEYSTLQIGFRELYEAYVAALRDAGGIDFPGMLTCLIDVLDSDPWVLDNFRRTYRHIVVDEGQDLTPAQTELLRKLSGKELSLFVVADDRQSINEYAGGAFANAVALVERDAPVISLTDNFRCATQVLQAAERIAAFMESPQDTFVARGAPPGEMRLEAEETSRSEGEAVAQWVSSLMDDGLSPDVIAEGEDPRVYPEDIAVIARSRWLLESTIEALKRAGHKLSLNVDAGDVLGTAEGRTFLNALAVLADPASRPARRQLVNEISNAFGAEISTDSAQDPIAVLDQSKVPALREIANHLVRAGTQSADLDKLLGLLTDRFAEADWKQDAEEIGRAWKRYCTATTVQKRSLRGFLRHLTRAQLARPTDPGIRVLTIHRAKGLEFKAVALVGVYDGALPDYRARDAVQLNSERRSLYVAITRAQRVLRVSWPHLTVDRSGRSRKQAPSRFLQEAGLIDVLAG